MTTMTNSAAAKPIYTEQEIKDGAVFLLRMMPFITEGMSFEEAGRAVLARDEELYAVMAAKDEKGDFLRSQLASEVYAQIRNRNQKVG